MLQITRRSSLRLLCGIALALSLSSTASAQDWAKKRLEDSPRHLEFVKVKAGEREVNCFIAYPEVKEKATAVIVIHEIFGLSDWVRGVTDQLAEAGYIAIAPDLLSGMAPNGGGTDELAKNDSVRKVISNLKPEQITKDLDAVAGYVTKLDAANGKLAVGGFCWGGGQTFRYATNNKDVKLAMVFYGNAPDKAEDAARIAAPVHGFYGENDARINAGIPKAKELLAAAKKAYDPVIYEGAGHGFMRAGEAPDAKPADKKAREAAWKRIKELLGKV